MTALNLDYYELTSMMRGNSLPLTKAGTEVLKAAVEEVLAQDNAEQQARAVLDWAFGEFRGDIVEMSKRYPQVDFESDYIIITLGATLDRVKEVFERLINEQRFAGFYEARAVVAANLRHKGGGEYD